MTSSLTLVYLRMNILLAWHNNLEYSRSVAIWRTDVKQASFGQSNAGGVDQTYIQ